MDSFLLNHTLIISTSCVVHLSFAGFKRESKCKSEGVDMIDISDKNTMLKRSTSLTALSEELHRCWSMTPHCKIERLRQHSAWGESIPIYPDKYSVPSLYQVFILYYIMFAIINKINKKCTRISDADVAAFLLSSPV